MTSNLYSSVWRVYCDFATHRPVRMLQGASATRTEANYRPIPESAPRRREQNPPQT